MPTVWLHRSGSFDLTSHGLVMGILNVTPDSFSDGGSYLNPADADRQAERLESEGADLIDIGGESTRPGSQPVDPGEEIRRVVPVIHAIRLRSRIPISIDTTKAEVAREALEAGADIVNDVSGFRADAEMIEVVARAEAGVVIMHMRGTPRTMQENPFYADPVGEVGEFLRQQAGRAIACGMDARRIVLDPGIGFGKTAAHNRALLLGLPDLISIGFPVLVGVSRKSFLAWASGAARIEDRYWGGVALTSFCRELGARVFRVHEPRPHREALRMTEAILGAAVHA